MSDARWDWEGGVLGNGWKERVEVCLSKQCLSLETLSLEAMSVSRNNVCLSKQCLSLEAISSTTEIPETAVESRFYWYMVSADTQTQKLTNQNG